MIINEAWLKRLLLIGICFIFILLLFKNPFSERNLIPNLEPFPDTIHYLDPPLNLISRKGFFIEREGRIMKPSVPFLYSASLIPGFIINSDARFFYFTNVILAILGFWLFYKFLEKVLENSYITFFILFLYITNYFIFWYPNLAMAENLLLTLYLLGIYLFVKPPTAKNAVLAGFVGISFYATKYASVSLAAAYLFAYLIKVINELVNQQANKFNVKKFILLPITILKSKGRNILFTYILSATLALFLFSFLDFLIRGNNIFFQLFELATPLVASQVEKTTGTQGASWFDAGYFNNHLYIYFNALKGEPMRFLWDQTPLIPKYVSLFAFIGIFFGLVNKKYRFMTFSLILFLIIPILAIASFYTTDARYIYHSIPTMLTFFGLSLVFLYKILYKYRLKKLFYIILISIFAFYSITNFQRLKYQIALNLRHAETPWYYLSVKNFNEYFAQNLADKPILITALQPYYIDFFSNSNYKLLPLSEGQEFMRVPEKVWGENDYTDFIALYKSYLTQGKLLFVTNAALGNEGYLHAGFDQIKANFSITKVKEGCFETCSIYKVELKP